MPSKLEQNPLFYFVDAVPQSSKSNIHIYMGSYNGARGAIDAKKEHDAEKINLEATITFSMMGLPQSAGLEELAFRGPRCGSAQSTYSWKLGFGL